jgi:hypothetical protein
MMAKCGLVSRFEEAIEERKLQYEEGIIIETCVF